MGAVLLDARLELLRWMGCRIVRFRARLSPATASLATNASCGGDACTGGSGCQQRCRQGRVVGPSAVRPPWALWGRTAAGLMQHDALGR